MKVQQRKLEQDLVIQFSTELSQQFVSQSNGKDRSFLTYAGSALGAQDKELSDYLLAANARFALIEFKADENCIQTETKKPLRLILCSVFDEKSDVLARARAMHFIAWGENGQPRFLDPLLSPQITRQIKLASYADKVCELLGSPFTLSNLEPIESKSFINSFLEYRTKGDSWKRFKRYLQDLYQLADEGGSSEALGAFQGSVYVFLSAKNGGAEEVVSIPFIGLEHLFELTIHYEDQREKVRALERERALSLEEQQPLEKGRERTRSGPRLG